MSPISVAVREDLNLAGLNLRREPRIAPNNIIKALPPGTILQVTEPDVTARPKVGQPGQWIQVRDPAGSQGYVYAQYVQLVQETPRGTQLVVNPDLDTFLAGGLALRDAPQTGAVVAREWPGTVLDGLETAEAIQSKLGRAGQWLNVRDPAGRQGYVAAWLVRGRDGVPPEVVAQAVVIAVFDARLFDAPVAGSPSSWRVTAGTPLYVAELGNWPVKLGRPDQFIRVRSYAFKDGYVQASLLAVPGSVDRRVAVVDAALPYGECAWLYGLHDPYNRDLFSGSGKTGWVLFTERVTSGTGNSNYRAWSETYFYGVVARLNNDYGGTGTIPAPSEYDRFAAQCAQWVQRSPGCHIWIIGNEMNNPREWPEEGRRPDLMITPESYADCFNRVRAAIKAVQPGAIVVPGAVDPYLGPSMSCLEWLNRMLAAIRDLDGIALHCYTHGYTPNLVTDLARFQDDPLRWQYYHFRCYATFLDVIPLKWRAKPIYVTETDPYGSQPWSGGQNGWVQAAYSEIDRWNRQPFSQQIQALVLYRWSRDDAFSIVDKPGVQNDIRATIQSTDYRWRR